MNPNQVKRFAKRVPVIGPLAVAIKRKLVARSFAGSETYWIRRYLKGGDSGSGSYSRLAIFKAKILNDLIEEKEVRSVIEYGCGDGNQLRGAQYPHYIGFDVSEQAILRCKGLFRDDATKAFRLMSDYRGETADLTLSLDVVFHLIEDDVYESYMRRLFDSSMRFVVVYSSNTDENETDQPPHVRHRKFVRWVCNNRPNWKLVQHVPSPYPLTENDTEGTFADFFIFQSDE